MILSEELQFGQSGSKPPTACEVWQRPATHMLGKGQARKLGMCTCAAGERNRQKGRAEEERVNAGSKRVDRKVKARAYPYAPLTSDTGSGNS
jgi:hypothetical protein